MASVKQHSFALRIVEPKILSVSVNLNTCFEASTCFHSSLEEDDFEWSKGDRRRNMKNLALSTMPNGTVLCHCESQHVASTQQ